MRSNVSLSPQLGKIVANNAEYDLTLSRMIVTKTPFVVPSRLVWFGLLFLIGTLGFFAQILITMGIKREAAGRASMAVYTQVISPVNMAPRNLI
jgi:drug/metabolite transporter (DMT)-like permease